MTTEDAMTSKDSADAEHHQVQEGEEGDEEIDEDDTTNNKNKNSSNKSTTIVSSSSFTVISSLAAPPCTPITTRTPINSRWTLWFDNPRFATTPVITTATSTVESTASATTSTTSASTSALWKDNLTKCGSFDTVETFWRIYNNVKPPSQLSLNSNYHLFREGILPTWEDPINRHGGKFVYTIPKKVSKSGVGDEAWMFTVLAVIGETMDLDGNQVVGAVVSIRKSQDRIALWIKCSDKHICRNIGLRWKQALGIHTVNLKYQIHADGTCSMTFKK